MKLDPPKSMPSPQRCLKFNRCWQTIKAWDHLLSFPSKMMMMIIYGCLLIHIHILWSDKAILKMVCFNKLTHCEVWLESPRLAPFMLCTTCTARKTHHDKQPAYIILQLIWLTIVLYICNEFFVTQGEAAAASLWFIWRSGIFFLGKLEWIFWTITLTETTPPKHSISSWLLKKITLTLFFW